MNSLNLRVSSVKSGENMKKNSEIRAALVILPKQYEMSEELYCVELKNANTVPEQVAAIKSIFKNLGSDPKALQFLADMFFYSPLKHPVRNQILKLLITAARLGTGSIDESSIVLALTHTLQRFVDETKVKTESMIWNISVTSISGCFENFECGIKAVKECLSSVFPFLYAAVQKYLTELGVLGSPSVRNEYYLYVHNAIRLILSCVQEFSKVLKVSNTEQLKQLNVVCELIILDEEIPMDPRTNSGILLAQTAKIFDEYDTIFIPKAKLIKNPNEIALCVGVVNTFDHRDFQRISSDIRDICTKIDEIANANAAISNILLCAARALFQVSKVLLSFDLKSAKTLDDAKLILRKLLIFTFGYLEHHMDSVRHICKDILKNIVAKAKRIKFEFLLQKIYDACNSERLSLSMKCIVMQQSVMILGANELIKNCSELFPVIFAEYLGRDFIVNNLFEALMLSSYKETSFDNWYKLWIHYLLDIASERDGRLGDIEILIVKAVKCQPKIVEKIIGQTDSTIPVSTKLSTLWAVRKEGIKMDNFNDIMNKFSKSLLHSILSNNDDTSIMALRLLVETHKTTELLTPLECENILTYLEYNSNTQSPATRQKSIALLSKVLIRCELNLMKVLRTEKPTKSTGAISKIAKPPAHLIFFINFIKILVGNLFNGANFSRRSISLQLLEQCIRICINLNLKLEDTLPNDIVLILIGNLEDSYETNKELAVNILKLIEDKLDCSLMEIYNIPIGIEQILEMLISVRPMDSVTGAYLLEFRCNRLSNRIFGDYECTAYNPTYYSALRWLLYQLKIGLNLAKQSILQAAKLNPLYGLLFAIRHMLKHLSFTHLAAEVFWRLFIAELIVMCKELTSVVGPIVNSSSPEGHLPNDFSELPLELLNAVNETTMTTTPTPTVDTNANTKETFKETSERDSPCKILSSRNSLKLDMTNVKTTPQMVLLCAWRTVKEVSLILGDIVLRSPIQSSKLIEEFLITKEQILEIGEHFKQLLSETKHRGAFEQAYVGFSKLCSRLWRVEVNDLNTCPMQWLRELLTIIMKDEQINEKICATRRSAGVPFMVQALITSELQVGTIKALNYCMTQLLQLCASTERSSECRTHALNILRALFRCTDLNETVGEFIHDGVICAIRGYDAKDWSEKNSATLLFAALITRIFGVQRTKDADNLNIRNKMTGRVFFLRYPKLYDFFLDELKIASNLTLQQQKANKLHPLLLILSRLYPSASEGTKSNLILDEFIPYIQNCAGCAAMPTRVLASKAILALITKDSISITILKKLAEIIIAIDKPNEINHNIVHGNLLQICMLLKNQKSIDSETINDIACTLVTFYEKSQLKNAVLLKVILDIFIEILKSLSTMTVSQDTLQNLLYFCTNQDLDIVHMSYFYPVLRKTFYIYNLHTLRLTLPYGAISDYLLNPPITHPTVKEEQAETCLNIILFILIYSVEVGNQEPILKDAIQEFDITENEEDFVRKLNSETLVALAKELTQSKALEVTLKEVIQKPQYYPDCAMKAFAILSLLQHFESSLGALMEEARRQPNDIKSTITMCIERLIIQEGVVDFKTSQLCLEYLNEIAQPWSPDCLRIKAARILAHISAHYQKALIKRKLNFIRLYIGLTISLLMDDDSDIRDYTTRIVLANIPDDLGMDFDNVVSTMAVRLFLQFTADILIELKADENYIIEIFKIITELFSNDTNASHDDDVSGGGGDNNSNGSAGGSSNTSSKSSTSCIDLEVFDKNEANVYAEPTKVIIDSIVVFNNTFPNCRKVLKFVNEFKES